MFKTCLAGEFDPVVWPKRGFETLVSSFSVCDHVRLFLFSGEKINDPLHRTAFHLPLMANTSDNPARQSCRLVYFAL